MTATISATLTRHLKRVREAILDHPANFNMALISPINGQRYPTLDDPGCGTAACIAGWLAMSNPDWGKRRQTSPNRWAIYPQVHVMMDECRDIPTYRQLENLFFMEQLRDDHWPEHIAMHFDHVELDRLGGHRYTMVTPEMAADAIDQFIESGEVDWFTIISIENMRDHLSRIDPEDDE